MWQNMKMVLANTIIMILFKILQNKTNCENNFNQSWKDVYTNAINLEV